MPSHLFIANHLETEKKVRVEPLGDGRYIVELDGAVHHVDARRFGGGNWSLIIDSQSYDVELEVAGKSESEGHYNSLVRGQLVRLRVRDERQVRMALTSKKFTLEGPQTLLSPMPGKIVKILVQPGMEVTEGQSTVIIEAMKMENELRAPKTGKIGVIVVKEGQTVDAHAKLLTIE